LLAEKIVLFFGDGAAAMIERNSGFAEKLKKQKERTYVNDLVSTVFF
jgi:hypothetical protein